jgi:hypothetical protein
MPQLLAIASVGLLLAAGCSSVQEAPADGGGAHAEGRADGATAQPDRCMTLDDYWACVDAPKEWECGWLLRLTEGNSCNGRYEDFGCYSLFARCDEQPCAPGDACTTIPTSNTCHGGVAALTVYCRHACTDPDASVSLCLPASGQAQDREEN